MKISKASGQAKASSQAPEPVTHYDLLVAMLNLQIKHHPQTYPGGVNDPEYLSENQRCNRFKKQLRVSLTNRKAVLQDASLQDTIHQIMIENGFAFYEENIIKRNRVVGRQCICSLTLLGKKERERFSRIRRVIDDLDFYLSLPKGMPNPIKRVEYPLDSLPE